MAFNVCRTVNIDQLVLMAHYVHCCETILERSERYKLLQCKQNNGQPRGRSLAQSKSVSHAISPS